MGAYNMFFKWLEKQETKAQEKYDLEEKKINIAGIKNSIKDTCETIYYNDLQNDVIYACWSRNGSFVFTDKHIYFSGSVSKSTSTRFYHNLIIPYSKVQSLSHSKDSTYIEINLVDGTELYNINTTHMKKELIELIKKNI